MEFVIDFFVFPLVVILTCTAIGGMVGWAISRFMPNT